MLLQRAGDRHRRGRRRRRQHRLGRRRRRAAASGRKAPARFPVRSATASAGRADGDRRQPRARLPRRRAARRRGLRLDAGKARGASRSRSPLPLVCGWTRRPMASTWSPRRPWSGRSRAVSTDRGRDPRDFTLVAFGGNGPLHRRRVGAPAGHRAGARAALAPGLFSAFGLLSRAPTIIWSEPVNPPLAELRRRASRGLPGT